MEFSLNAKVACTDGPCGESVTVILDPTTQKVTYVVVQDKTFPHPVPRLVPVGLVEESRPDLIRLRCTKDELAEMEEFVETQYIQTERMATQTVAPSYDLPYVVPVETVTIPVEVERVPPGEVAVRRGTTVEAKDGYVGKVGELVVDPESGHITHFTLQEGHLYGKREITVPLSAIDFVHEDTVYLKLDKQAVGQLPGIQVRRRGKEGTQSELMVRVFDSPGKADEALEFLKGLRDRKIVKILNSAVLVKDQDGNTSLQETGDLDAKQGRLFGAITGGLIGLVGGPVGAVVGALAGAGAGGIAAKWIDAGFSDTFLQGLQERLEPGSSALLILVEHKWAESLSEAMGDLEGVAFRETLSDALVAQLLEEEISEV